MAGRQGERNPNVYAKNVRVETAVQNWSVAVATRYHTHVSVRPGNAFPEGKTAHV